MIPTGTNTPHFQSRDDPYRQQPPKKESNNSRTPSSANNTSASCLKINKESRAIKKSLPPSSSPAHFNNMASFTSNHNHNPQPQQQRPVIIYTHSPTVVNTTPEEFMTLVQKLTGMPRRTEDEHQQPTSSPPRTFLPPPPPPTSLPVQQHKSEAKNYEDNNNNSNNRNVGGNLGIIGDNNETNPISIDETNDYNNKGGGLCDLPVMNSGYIPSSLEFDHLPNLSFSDINNNNNNGIPFFNPNSADFSYTSQPFYSNYSDLSSFYLPSPNLGNAYSSSSSLDALKDLPDF